MKAVIIFAALLAVTVAYPSSSGGWSSDGWGSQQQGQYGGPQQQGQYGGGSQQQGQYGSGSQQQGQWGQSQGQSGQSQGQWGQSQGPWGQSQYPNSQQNQPQGDEPHGEITVDSKVGSAIVSINGSVFYRIKYADQSSEKQVPEPYSSQN